LRQQVSRMYKVIESASVKFRSHTWIYLFRPRHQPWRASCSRLQVLLQQVVERHQICYDVSRTGFWSGPQSLGWHHERSISNLSKLRSGKSRRFALACDSNTYSSPRYFFELLILHTHTCYTHLRLTYQVWFGISKIYIFMPGIATGNCILFEGMELGKVKGLG